MRKLLHLGPALALVTTLGLCTLDGLLAPNARAQTYFESTNFFERLPVAARAGDVRMVAWQDVDADGRPDLLALRGNGGSTLVQNGPTGWVDRTPVELLGPDDWRAALWIELDDDPYPELLVLREGADDLLLDNLGHFVFAPASPTGLLLSVHPESAAAADFDLDGDLDVIVATDDGEDNHLWRNDGGLTFVDIAPVWPFVQELYDSKGIAWADLDDDLAPDCFVGGSGAAPLFEINIMSASFSFATLRGLDGLPTPECSAFAWGDIDNDGFLDLVVGNTAGAQRRFERQLPLVYFEWTPEAQLDLLRDTAALATADLDNDGWLDVVQNNLSTPVEVLRNLGDGSFARGDQAGLDFDTGGGPLAFADVDDDGDLDVFLGHAHPDSTSRLLRNPLDGSVSWLTVELAGTTANTRGIGATVRVKSDGTWRRREIRAGDGYRVQSPSVAHFGLGAATSVDSVTVTWPGGLQQVYTDFDANQHVVIVEDPISTGVGDVPGPIAAGGAVRLHPAAPNPFNPRTSLRFEVLRAGAVRLEIFDLSGRRVKTMVDGNLEVGEYSRTWNGTDERGLEVASGVYLVRLHTADSQAVTRVGLVR